MRCANKAELVFLYRYADSSFCLQEVVPTPNPPHQVSPNITFLKNIFPTSSLQFSNITSFSGPMNTILTEGHSPSLKRELMSKLCRGIYSWDCCLSQPISNRQQLMFPLVNKKQKQNHGLFCPPAFQMPWIQSQ